MCRVFSKSLLLPWLQFPLVSVIMRSFDHASPRLVPFLFFTLSSVSSSAPSTTHYYRLDGYWDHQQHSPGPTCICLFFGFQFYVLTSPPVYHPLSLSPIATALFHGFIISSGSFLEPSDLAAPLGPLKSVFRCLLQEILLKCTAPDVTAFGCLIKNRRSLTESPQTMSSLWFLLPCWSSTEPAPDAGKCRTSNVSCCPIPEDLAQLSVRLGCNLFPHLLLKPFFIYLSHFILCKGFPDPAWRIQAQSAAFPRRKDISL